MSSKKVFNIKTKTGMEIDIPINNKVTIITGDSATGKTKMVKIIKDLLTDREIISKSTVNLDSIIVCGDKESVQQLIHNKHKDKLIIIDRFDSLDNDEQALVEYIDNTENLFIVMAHKELPQCGYDYSSILSLVHNGTSYKAVRLFKTPSDYLVNQNILI